MKDHILERLDSTTELLQYNTASTVITQSDRTYTATGIGTGFAVGDIVVIAGAANSASNGTFTITTTASGAFVVAGPAIGANETATITVNQEYQGEWKEVNQFSHLLSVINTSGAAYVYVDQSADGVNTDYTTTITVVAATAKADSIETLLPFARLRVRTNAADQTTLRAYLYGRRLT